MPLADIPNAAIDSVTRQMRLLIAPVTVILQLRVVELCGKLQNYKINCIYYELHDLIWTLPLIHFCFLIFLTNFQVAVKGKEEPPY